MRRVIEDRRQPAFALRNAPALAPGVILDLVALDLADAEIGALRMAEIKPAHRRARPYGEALGQLHADALGLQQLEQRALLGVVGLPRITRRRADAAIFLGDQLAAGERLARGAAPELLAHALVQSLG